MSETRELAKVCLDKVLEEFGGRDLDREEIEENYKEVFLEYMGREPNDYDYEVLNEELNLIEGISIEKLKKLLGRDNLHWSEVHEVRKAAEALAFAGVVADLDWKDTTPLHGEDDDGQGTRWVSYEFTLTLNDEEVVTWERRAEARLLGGLGPDYMVTDFAEYVSGPGFSTPEDVVAVLEAFEIENPEFVSSRDVVDEDDNEIEVEGPWHPDFDTAGPVGVFWETVYGYTGVTAYGRATDAIEGIEFARAFDENGLHDIENMGFVRRATPEELNQYNAALNQYNRQFKLFPEPPPEPPGDIQDQNGSRWFHIAEVELEDWE